MAKRFLVFVLLFLLLLSSAFCAVYTDGMGRSVEIKSTRRVACLLSSYADLWRLSGGNVSVTVQESIDRGYADSSAVLVDKSSGMNINSELLLASRPDLVILSSTLSSHTKLEPLLKSAGIPAYYMALESFDDYLSALQTFTTINGRPDLYEAYGLKEKSAIEKLIASSKNETVHPKVLFLRAGAGFSSTKARSSEDHFAAAILKDLGAINIADASRLKDSLSLEAVIEGNPDWIFIITQGDPASSESYVKDLFQTPGWRDLSAVKEGKVLFLERELFHFKPNAQWGEAYRVMYGHLYGETR